VDDAGSHPLLIATEPAFAGLFAYLLQGERLSALGWLGAGLIMAAILAVEARAAWAAGKTPAPLRRDPA